MGLILLLVILFCLFGGGYYGHSAGYWGGSAGYGGTWGTGLGIGGIVLLVIVVLLVTGRL